MATVDKPFTFRGDLPLTDIMYARAKNVRSIESLSAHMVQRERLLLYSMVFAKAPRRCLEIGVMHGGSSRIIRQALEDLGQGRLISVDPAPQLDFDWSTISDRATLIIDYSPEALKKAMTEAGGRFDFVFVDGDHSYRAIQRDLKGLIDVTEPGAIILMHDAYFATLAAGVDHFVSSCRAYLDMGIVCTTANPGVDGDGTRCTFGGLRLLMRTRWGIGLVGRVRMAASDLSFRGRRFLGRAARRLFGSGSPKP